MRITEFWERMGEAFGPAYAESLARDQSLSALGGRTATEALAGGVSAKEVWRVVFEQFGLPAKLR